MQAESGGPPSEAETAGLHQPSVTINAVLTRTQARCVQWGKHTEPTLDMGIKDAWRQCQQVLVQL